MNTSIDKHILYWLISLGYKLYGREEADILAMFHREAAQWGVAPERLSAWIALSFDQQGLAPLAPEAFGEAEPALTKAA